MGLASVSARGTLAPWRLPADQARATRDMKVETRVGSTGQRVLSLALIVALAIPLPWQFAPWGLTVYPFTLVLAPLLVAWATEARLAFQTGRRGSPSRTDPVILAALFLFGWMAASNIATGATWRHAVMWPQLVLLYAFAKYRLPYLARRDDVGRWLGFVVVGLVAISTVQWLTVSSFGAVAHYFGREVQNSQVWGQAAPLKRIQGTFFHANILAQWLAYVMIWFSAHRDGNRRARDRAIILLSAAMVVLTFSRTAWVALPIVLFGVSLAWARSEGRMVTRLVGASGRASVLILVFILLAPSAWTSRFTSDQGSSAQRSEALTAGVTIAQEAPAFGVGYEQFLDAGRRMGARSALRPHNIFVQVFAEQGIFVLAMYLVLIGLLFREGVRGMGRSGLYQGRRIAVTALVLTWCVFMTAYETSNEYAVLPVLFLLVGESSSCRDASMEADA